MPPVFTNTFIGGVVTLTVGRLIFSKPPSHAVPISKNCMNCKLLSSGLLEGVLKKVLHIGKRNSLFTTTALLPLATF